MAAPLYKVEVLYNSFDQWSAPWIRKFNQVTFFNLDTAPATINGLLLPAGQAHQVALNAGEINENSSFRIQSNSATRNIFLVWTEYIGA